MAMLKSRQKFIPGGFKFFQPETGWRAPNNASFNTIVQAIIRHRKAQPFLAKKHKWPLDPATVADEVDRFNAMICEQMGWSNYVQAAFISGPPPKFPAPSPSDQKRLAAAAGRAKKIWAGVRTLNDWIDSNDPPVPRDQAEARAASCVKCPHNGQGDFTTWFTRPAAAAIQRQIERMSNHKLSTKQDDKLNVCTICLCPLKLKVHTPLNYVNAHLSEAIFQEMRNAPDCWIVRERAQ